MFSHILLATDGSEHARRAAAAAVALAKKFGARLTLVNVYPPPHVFEPTDETHDAHTLGLREVRQNMALSCAEQIADEAGIVRQSLREQGHCVELIVKTAKQTGADLIVIGSRGLGDIGSFLLGSVSDGVLHHAHCPVLIVRTPSTFHQDTRFQNILLASDGSDCAVKSAEAAVAIAKQFESRLTIVNVYQPPVYTDPYGGSIICDSEQKYIVDFQNEAIRAAGQIAEKYGAPYCGRKEIGNTAAVIVDAAEQEHCDLIVLGSRGLGGVQSFLLGSISRRIAHYAHCPVLVVK
ncbi:universal stress protein [Capsulimonas corticalis]|uniref:Universal stress protein n=1 Tax=Capsulimonas corticalis TaxID=2219043 RepID=A0A402CXY1_9BACT|nr:universal stress protein [Capsulimonas corticalis]BDI32119.1 universal stress protein [Capsulimonas corticalis]